MEQTKDAEKKLKLKLSKANDLFLKSETEDGSFIDVLHVDRLDGTHVFTLLVPLDDRSEDTTATYILEANFLGSFGGVGGPLPGSPYRIQTCQASDYDGDEKKAMVCLFFEVFF